MNRSVYSWLMVILGDAWWTGYEPLPPELFLQHDELYSVSFDKGDGPRTLGPEQLITTPRALVRK